jgi:Uma2 family endonuclease
MAEATTDRAVFVVPSWLPPDTEESVMGTQWHQEAIDALASMLVEVGRRQGQRWGVARGITLLDTGARYPNGKPYDPKPDVMVLPQPLPDGDITGISLRDVGVPLFIAEVASKSTWNNDLSFKKEVYAFARVEEYIAFDPSGHFITPALQSWRLDNDTYTSWNAAGDGWWHSRALDVTFQAAQPFLAVRDRDGRHVSPPRRAFEREYRVEQLEQELAEARQLIADLNAQARRQHRE